MFGGAHRTREREPLRVYMFVLWPRRVILFVFSYGEVCSKNTVRSQIQFIMYACLCVCVCACGGGLHVRPST